MWYNRDMKNLRSYSIQPGLGMGVDISIQIKLKYALWEYLHTKLYPARFSTYWGAIELSFKDEFSAEDNLGE
jgi:hypothetical protein